eukprot:1218303-Prorocentrum_lima.AAC.1
MSAPMFFPAFHRTFQDIQHQRHQLPHPRGGRMVDVLADTPPPVNNGGNLFQDGNLPGRT